LTAYETEIISYCSVVRGVRAGAGRMQQFQRQRQHGAPGKHERNAGD
jgi:hypothetical protein